MTMSMYLPPSLRRFSPNFICFSTWIDHLPFAYDLVAAVRPKLTVELGTQGGLSFFGFCQSMVENDIDGICYAVDTWEGEDHTGKYDESVFDSVNYHCRQNYAGFAYLMRMLFEDALPHFKDESIDLLHIDGLHTYDAVKNDFDTWYPKVKPGGIILFHDIHARMKDFGVWKFWEELSEEHNTFGFAQGFGLGVLRKPGGEPLSDPLLTSLFEGGESEHEQLRAFYAHAANFFGYRRKVEQQEKISQARKNKK